MKRHGAALLGPVLLFTASCVVPLPRVKPQVGPERIARVEVGTSNKDEVRSLLRKPSVEITEDIWVYSWFTRKLNLFVAIAPGVGDVGPVGVRDYRALVVFGPDGRVADFQLQTRPNGSAAKQDRVAPSRSAKLPVKGAVHFRVEGVSDSPQVLAGCWYGDICTWRLDAPEDLKRRKLPRVGGIPEIAFSAAGDIAVSGSSGTVLVGADEDDWHTLRTPGRGRVGALAFSSDGKMLAIARRRTVSVFDLTLSREIELPESPNPVIELHYSPQNALLVTAACGIVQVFRTDTGALLTSIPTPCLATGIAFSPDGERLAVNGGTYVAIYAVSDLVSGDLSTAPRQVVLLPFGTGTAQSISGPVTPCYQIAYSGSSRYLAAATEHSVVVLELPAGTVVDTLPHPEAFFSDLAFLGDDRIATFSRSRSYEWTLARP